MPYVIGGGRDENIRHRRDRVCGRTRDCAAGRGRTPGAGAGPAVGAGGRGQFPAGVERAPGDALDPDLPRHLGGIDAVIHLVGIIREFPARNLTFERLHVAATENVLRAMTAAGVRRIVHMSALGAGPDATTGYFASKWRAETAVRESGLDWTVMKPSVVFGPGDEFVNMLAGQVRLPLVPVIGDGRYRLQPVAAADVAAGFARTLAAPAAAGKTYEIGGPRQYTYNELLDAIGRAVGKARVRKVHVPLALMRPMVRALERFSFFPVTGDQLSMLLMSNVCDPTPFYSDLGIAPTGLEEGIGKYLGTG
jgi:uncharacterized protein YbjT (DUF2867 family)